MMHFRFRLAALLVGMLFFPLSSLSFAQNVTQPTSPWKIDFAGPLGVSVAYRGVPLIRRSSLYVVKPGWAGLLFDQRAQKTNLTKRDDGTLHVECENVDFSSQYDLTPVNDSTFEMRFKGQLKRDIPAQIEFAAGYFNANLIANRSFTSQKSGDRTTSTGIVPAFPRFEGLMPNDLAPEWKSLQFDSRIGKIEIDVQSKSRVAFADARRDTQSWAREAPVFWMGWMAGAQSLKYGTPVEMTLRIRVEPTASAAGTRPTTEIKPAVLPVSDAISTRDKPLEIVPRPQKISVIAGKQFVLRNGVRASIVAPRGETRLRAALQKMLRDEWNIETAAPRELAGDAGGWSRIVLGTKKLEIATPKTLPSWANHTDAYRLVVDGNGIEISAPTARGAFYGIQTLAQLLRPAGKSVVAARVEIEDYAALQFRGAHWFPSASGVPFHKKLIGVMARAKMNSAVIQCEAAKWDSHPEIAAPNSISKADLRALVALCRANFIEPIPLINTPGHAEWMFRNGQNLELAEDSQTPYAYAVGNPKSLPFIHQIFGEAIEVFQPQTFHIGHDEVTMRGRFPNPENPFYRPGQTTTDLVMENLRSLHAWLGARKIKTMVWSDMFLHHDEGPDAASAPSVAEAQKRRQMLPEDVIVADWHYGGNEKYPSLGLFAKDGLQTIASTWNTPQNIRYFSRAARENKSLGLLQTTWAGYFPDANTLNTQLSQFTSFILAGDYAWAGRDEAPSSLPYDAVAQWSQAYEPQKGGESAGAMLDLGAAAQVTPTNWLGLGAGRDLSALFSGQNTVRRLADVNFQIPAQKMIALSGAPTEMAPPGALGELTLNVGARAAQIALLHSTLWSVPDGVVAARMHVEYSDSTRSEFDLTTGRTIVPWQSEGVAVNARRGWSTKSPDGTPVGLRVTRWSNPFPAKNISRIRFAPVDIEAGYALAGVTLIEK